MATYTQLCKYKTKRKKKFHWNWSKRLKGCPYKKAYIVRLRTMRPKKPNSAIRRIAKVRLSYGRLTIAYVPGQSNTLIPYHDVLIRGGKRTDLPCVHYQCTKGVYDFRGGERIIRYRKRSKYGLLSFKRLKFIFGSGYLDYA